MLTRRARRRKRIVNWSPGLQDMSKRVGWGEVGSKRQKKKKKAKMKEKGRAARYKVGPRAGPSRAARHGGTRVPISAPKHHFNPRATFSHTVRSSSTPGMSISKREGMARKPRRIALLP